jgi:hypothetical protein
VVSPTVLRFQILCLAAADLPTKLIVMGKNLLYRKISIPQTIEILFSIVSLSNNDAF